MKSKIFSMGFICAIALASCSGNTQEQKPTTPLADSVATAPAKVTEWEFDTRYVVTLNAGRADADENTVIDAAHAEQTNVGELKPVWGKVVADLLAGKLAAHPVDGNTDAENNPATYGKRAAKSIPQGPATAKSLGDRFEARFKSHAKDGHSTHVLSSISLIHAPGNDNPDFEMATLMPADLGAYMIGDKTLQAYLEAMQYESYIVEVKTADKQVKIGAMTEVAALEDKVNKGDLSEL